MEAIFGRMYRRQQYQQPLWLRILLGCFSIVAVYVLCQSLLRGSRFVWAGFSTLTPGKQSLIGRLIIFTFGLTRLFASMDAVRRRFYLDPPMRDLVTAPISQWRLLKLGLRSRMFSEEMLLVPVGAFFIYPWFAMETLANMLPSAWDWQVPLSILCTVGFTLLFCIVVDTLAIALNLVLAAWGLGGAAPTHVNIARVLHVLRLLAISVAWLILIPALTVVLVRKPSLDMQAWSFWKIGSALIQSISEEGSVPAMLFRNFPPVAWFDMLHTVISGDPGIFRHGMFCCAGWIVGSLVMAAYFLKSGLDIDARAEWHDDPVAPKPADALKTPRRAYDPDASSGPIESWLLTRLGRMGRAAVRLIAAVFDVGSIDRHLMQSMKMVPICLLSAYALMAAAPPVVLEVHRMLGGHRWREYESETRTFVAVVAVVLFAVARLRIWGGVRLSGTQNMQTSPGSPRMRWGQNRSEFSLLLVADPSMTLSRGDNRHPLFEIYPVGFSDGVLLTSLYMLISLLVMGVCALLEGILLGLPYHWMLWSVGIAIPLLAEACFLATVLNFVSSWIDYRRSRLITFVKLLVAILISYVVVGGIAGLIVILSIHAVNHDQAWVAWVGAMNILLVFNIALYMSARWVYVRRRFDAERRKRQRWA